MATIEQLPMIARDTAIRQCLWPLIKLARHVPTNRVGTIIGRRRAARHGWDLLVRWGRGLSEWLPCTELRLEFETDADRADFAVKDGGRS